MVFVNEAWNGTGDIVVYSNYHKYWLGRERKIKNPLFDVYSGKILDLKEGKPQAVKYFYNLLDAEICDGVTICVVPSSNADKKITGNSLYACREILLQNGAEHVEMFALGKAI